MQCDYQGTDKAFLERHIKLKHSTKEEFNCMQCDFQGTDKAFLEKHFKLKHSTNNAELTFKCYYCHELFCSKWDLMDHRKNAHTEIVAQCRSNIEGKCKFSSERCWWSHDKKENEPLVIKCYLCDKTFTTLVQLMEHKKMFHLDTVKPCTKFASKMCKFTKEACWYKHDDLENNDEVDRKIEETSSDFQKVSLNPKPPIKV